VDFRNAGIARQLPWRQIISDQINSGKLTLNDFAPVIEDKRKDIAMKFQFLVEMAHHQYIRLEQATTFGTINIAKESEFGSDFFIKDEKGEYILEWQRLSMAQKAKVIKDLKEGVIVLV
jgi:hypothetical protein